VINRGNNRQTIYLDDRDRRHFLELLGEAVERYGVEVHTYVLMIMTQKRRADRIVCLTTRQT
jgi:hypothetical protein